MKLVSGVLIDQIKLRIRDTYMDRLKRNKQDSLAFFIRENNVQKVYPESVVSFDRGVKQKIELEGMNPKQVKNFINMVEEGIKQSNFDLYYCTLYIQYHVLGDDESDIRVNLMARNEKHFSWR